MDDDLKKKCAPQHNKRGRELPGIEALCAWAEALDWRTNDVHFSVLARRVLEIIDDELREKHGIRLDQLATWDDLLREMRSAVASFTPEHQKFLSIFTHLLLHASAYIGEIWRRKESTEGIV